MKIQNRKAYYEYNILDEFTCGIQLVGSEVKSLRKGEANISEAYVYVKDNEVFLISSFIYKNAKSSYFNHDEKRDRKLLLKRREINKLTKESTKSGITIIPLEIFLFKNRFKVKIGIAQGKKLYDKKNSIIEKDIKRQTDRDIKFNYV